MPYRYGMMKTPTRPSCRVTPPSMKTTVFRRGQVLGGHERKMFGECGGKRKISCRDDPKLPFQCLVRPFGVQSLLPAGIHLTLTSCVSASYLSSRLHLRCRLLLPCYSTPASSATNALNAVQSISPRPFATPVSKRSCTTSAMGRAMIACCAAFKSSVRSLRARLM